MILANTTLEFAVRSDGWVHLMQGEYDVLRGPLGVLLYLAFVPVYRFIPVSGRAGFLMASSLLLALLTLGHGYALTIGGLALIGFVVVRTCGTPSRRRQGVALLTGGFVGLLILARIPWLSGWKGIPWLPEVGPPQPVYFYLHWAGIAYLYLKTWHVLSDVAVSKMELPASRDFLAYALFAPTLRMGPIYRYDDFKRQLDIDPRENRSLKIATGRFLLGLVRLMGAGVLMGVAKFPVLMEDPGSLAGRELIVAVYLAPMVMYLWMGGYTDVCVAVGRTMGFVVPENFRNPWGATSIGEFWRRWHIPLGHWLRDYIYIPLGGNRRHIELNFAATFLFCGLWHGLLPSYVCWGLAQGIGLSVQKTWSAYWRGRRESGAGWYKKLARAGLVQSRLSVLLAWLVTFHYQVLTISWFMDEEYSGRLLASRLVEWLGWTELARWLWSG